MLTIRREQVDALGDAMLREFERAMIVHIRTWFPAHYRVLQDDGARAMVRNAHAKATLYGMATKRAVALYLNATLMLGAHFDTDPMYAWAAEILPDTRRHPRVRIDKVTDEMLKTFKAFAGARRIHLNRALVRFRQRKAVLLRELNERSLRDFSMVAMEWYPHKHAIVGEDALGRIALHASSKAASYGLRREPDVLLYALLMFLLGTGYDSDPQYSALRQVLLDTSLADSQSKANALYRAANAYLEQFLNGVKD